MAVVQAADVFVPALPLPGWILTAVALLAVLGFPVALVLHALLIEKDGRLVYEEYFTGADESLGEDLGQVAFGRTSLHDVRSRKPMSALRAC